MKHRFFSSLVHTFALLTALTIVMPSSVQAGGRAEMLKSIKELGKCTNVVMTAEQGYMMLYDKNTYVAIDCPEKLLDQIKKVQDKNDPIKDIQISEKGGYVLLSAYNGLAWSKIPSKLAATLKEYHSNDVEVNSVTFNDTAGWIVVGKDQYTASNAALTKWLDDGVQKHGTLLTAYITNEGGIASFEKGYLSFGRIPDDLMEALTKWQFKAYRIKFCGDFWFFSAENGAYNYYL